jgi:hypothetical protein
MGFLAYTADYIPMTDSLQPNVITCGIGPTSSIFALTPTVTPSGFSDPYQAPVDLSEWADLVPTSILSKCGGVAIPAAATAMAIVSALTTTSTQYDNYGHSPSSTAEPKVLSTVNAKPATTTVTIPAAATAAAIVSALTTTSTQYDNYVHSPSSTAEPKALSTVNAKPATTTDAQSTTILKGNQASQPKTTTRAAEDNISTPNPTTTSPSPIVISSVTITPGAPAVTVDGTEISLAASSSLLVVGTSTLSLGASSTLGYGSLVWSGLGGSGTAGSNTKPYLATFTGAGGKLEPTLHVKFVLICFIVSGLLSGTL